MFEHHTQEILDLLRSISHDIHTLTKLSMATLQEVKDAQATETQAIEALAGRVTSLIPPAASATDLDGLLATAQANTAAVNAIDPAAAIAQPVPAPAA